MRTLRVGLAQINTTIGDLEGNVARVLEYVGRARALGVDVVAFPELTVSGYPPEDLLLRPQFVRDNLEALEGVVRGRGGITAGGRRAGVSHKQRRPTYGVFDEMRCFRPGEGCPVYTIAGVGVGVNVCEDIWYPGEPTRAQAQAGAQVVVHINGPPYHAGKREFRQQMLATPAGDYGVFVCYTNQGGGQDELGFGRGSLGLGPGGGVG